MTPLSESIGDRYRVWDLAAVWRALTGPPFVFAVWAARPRAAASATLVGDLERSLERGLADLDRLVERAATELRLDLADIHEYLTRNLSYRLDRDALAGLRAFHARAFEVGLVESDRALAFAGEAPATDRSRAGSLRSPR